MRKSIKLIFVLMALTLFLTPAWGSVSDTKDTKDQDLSFFRNHEVAGTCVWVEFFEHQPVLARGGGSGGGYGGGSGGGYGNSGYHRMGSQGTDASQQQHQYQHRKTNKKQNQHQHRLKEESGTQNQNKHQHQDQYQHRKEFEAQN